MILKVYAWEEKLDHGRHSKVGWGWSGSIFYLKMF